LELLDDVGRRRQVGIAHAEIDDVGAGVARRGLGAVDLLEHIGRQAADAMKVFHEPWFPAGRRTLPGRRAQANHGVRAEPGEVPWGSALRAAAVSRAALSRIFANSSRSRFFSASLKGSSARAGGMSCTAG